MTIRILLLRKPVDWQVFSCHAIGLIRVVRSKKSLLYFMERFQEGHGVLLLAYADADTVL